jgi:beta-mannosidase
MQELPRHVQQLDQNWEFQENGSSPRLWNAVKKIPSNVHVDLVQDGLLDDPFLAKKEYDANWVGETDWIYRTSFDLSESSLSANSRVELVFDGLDTFVTVTLNRKIILEADNMFRDWRVDVRDILVIGQNKLQLYFHNAHKRGDQIVSSMPNHKWGCWNGDISRLAVRKAQYHFGWDWGPKLITCGPWRPIRLEYFTSRISDLSYETQFSNDLDRASVKVRCEVDGLADHILVEILSSMAVMTREVLPISQSKAEAVFQLSNPKLWYPVGYGEQHLYIIRARLMSGNDEVDVCSKQIGLRKARVAEKPLQNSLGTSFYFEINNIPIFCGGSNWIPADSFLTRVEEGKYRQWLQMLIQGNQTMVRIWGGGIYENDAFYDICDELGILVWQDFMFACGNYPAHQAFLDSVQAEAESNIRRLRHHPSIVIWAGNNEDYQYCESENLEYMPQDKNPDNWLQTTFPARYIYEKVLSDAMHRLCPDVKYHPGSPWGGRNTRDPTSGDIHQWDVWHGTQERYQDFDKLIGRFVSEFGMQGFPNVRTIDSFLPPDTLERFPQSEIMDSHNKAAGQARRLGIYLSENLRFNAVELEKYIFATQLLQSECLGAAYRLWKRKWKGKGREECAGALVWQLNDCWPCISWSIVDYFLRPKMAYYAVKRELGKVTVSAQRAPSRSEYLDSKLNLPPSAMVEIWATNLTLVHLRLTLKVKAFNIYSGEELLNYFTPLDVTLQANQSTELVKIPVLDMRSLVFDQTKIVLAIYLFDGVVQISRHINWPEPLKHLSLSSIAPIYEISSDKTSIQLSCSRPVKGLLLDFADDTVSLEDNGIDLVPGEITKLAVKGLSTGTRHPTLKSYSNQCQ